MEITNLSARQNLSSPPNPSTSVNPKEKEKIIAPQPKANKKKLNKVLKIVIIVFVALFGLTAIIAALGFFTVYLPGQELMTNINKLQAQTETIKAAVNEKDLDKIKTELETAKSNVAQVESSYKKLSMLSAVPVAKNYYADGKELMIIANSGIRAGEILIQAVEPYKDFLGIKGGSSSGNQTTEDRISFLTQSIEGLLPHIDSIETELSTIQESLDKIDPSRYPEEFKGYQIKSNLLKAQETVADVAKLVKDGKPILTKTSWLLGKDKPRNYLMIFQNDGELRPSGGFWTAYGTLSVSNGKITPGTSSNIYDLDDKLASSTPAPRIIKSYHINVPYLNLRDSNLSPDFPTDAEIFLEQYYKAMGTKTKYDALIALDTNVLVDLVKVLGKLDTVVGTFTSEPDKRCDGCPSIIYDLEWIAGRPRDYIEKDRKGFLGPLMHSLLSNAMGSEKTKIPLLAEAFFKNINQKHIMIYFPDTEMQDAANKANLSGAITQTDQNTDYFHLNDANFASAKSNIFITQKIKHEITTSGGKVEHKVSVTYTNPSPASNCNLEKGDLCLNAPKYRDMFRFYVPQGSTLTKMTGSEIDPLTYDELGKTVFEGFYGDKYPLYAKSSSKTSVQYTSSVPASKNYSLLLQKQPGTKPVEYELWVNGRKYDEFEWSADKTIKLSL